MWYPDELVADPGSPDSLYPRSIGAEGSPEKIHEEHIV